MIYYSHVNEDNLVEKKSLESGVYENLFCVAGSGERLLALLGHSTLQNVFVVDANEQALFLTELKVKAIQHLSIEEYLQFIAFDLTSKTQRSSIFQQFSPTLSPACRKFWENNVPSIEEGILGMGHFERFLKKVRPILKFWLGKSFYELFNHPRESLKSFPAIRWHTLKWFFGQGFTYRLFGNKDIAFVGEQAALENIPQGIEQTIRQNSFGQSFMNHLIFHGDLSNMSNTDIPLSMNKDYLKKVKQQLDKVELQYIHNDVLSAIKKSENQYFNNAFFSLSDLLSFEDVSYIQALLQEIKAKKGSESRVLLRAFARHRLDDEIIQNYLQVFGTFKDLTATERTQIYQVFDINISHEK